MVLEDACLWRHEIQNAYVVDFVVVESIIYTTTTTTTTPHNTTSMHHNNNNTALAFFSSLLLEFNMDQTAHKEANNKLLKGSFHFNSGKTLP